MSGPTCLASDKASFQWLNKKAVRKQPITVFNSAVQAWGRAGPRRAAPRRASGQAWLEGIMNT